MTDPLAEAIIVTLALIFIATMLGMIITACTHYRANATAADEEENQ